MYFFKQWDCDLERKATWSVGADESAAKRLVRQLIQFGLIEPANDMTYPSGGMWAYSGTNMLIAIRNIAIEAEKQGLRLPLKE